MKRIAIFSLAFAATLACNATQTYQTQNTFGVLSVTDASETNVLVSVPWVAINTDTNANGAVDMATLVSPDQLNKGDKLYVATANPATSYNVFKVNDSWQWEGVATATYSDKGILSETEATPEATTIARGNAVWLATSKTALYLVGQKPNTESGVTVTVANGWNLVASPTTTDIALSAITCSAGFTKGDQIIFPDNDGAKKSYIYKDGWKEQTMTGLSDASTVTFNAGRGFWFNSKSTGSKTIQFGN